MSEKQDSIRANLEASHHDASQVPDYQIRVKGHLDPEWSDWFDGLEITLEENGDTVLEGPVVDQAALFSLLRKVRNLGMPLISVTRSESGRTDRADAGS